MSRSAGSVSGGNKTKIICTIGPSSESVEMLTSMVKAGMNVARLNFSHGTHENHTLLINNIRTVAKNLNKNITIIQDLQGPKIRVLDLKEPVTVKEGQEVVIGQDFNLDFNIVKAIKVGQRILIEDGLIELEVKKVQGSKIYCLALCAGKIQSNKGVNLPNTKLTIPALTEKDIEDLKFGLQQDVDYVALSFVRSPKDVTELKKLILKYNPKNLEAPKIIVKIEKPEGVKNFDSILKVTDAVMVARGDLGVEMAENEVPIIQKTLIQKCLAASKPVIVATQMLDSMIRNPRPTRAEVSDVANAVIDQADCVMLSGESAFGKYPLEAVQAMSDIIKTTEKSNFLPSHKKLKGSKTEAEAESLFQLIEKTKAKAVIGITESGFTAREVAHERPHMAELLMFTTSPKVLRQLNLIWGVKAFNISLPQDLEQVKKYTIKTAQEEKIAKKGEKVIFVIGEAKKHKLNLIEVKTI